MTVKEQRRAHVLMRVLGGAIRRLGIRSIPARPATAPVPRARAGARPQGVMVVSTPASRTGRPSPQAPLAARLRRAKPAATISGGNIG